MITTNQMLEVLVNSENLLTAMHSAQILQGEMSYECSLSLGGFMTAVLNGNYELAIKLADSDNLECLHRIAD